MHKALLEGPWPTSRAMEDGQNFDVIANHPIRNDVGRTGHDKLTCSNEPARPPEVWMIAQSVDGSAKAGHNPFSGS